ncbi:MAG: threonine ammonia-lyase [Acidimicrobiales bacterium]|nr:threonine ammonia-lyase [Acidimicrobiales bacterium]
MRTDVQLVSLADVEAARPGLRRVLRPTPVEPSSTLSELCGRPVLLKPEHRQRTGSFKIRGAHHFIAQLGPEVTHVVAASAGNHAQGVALAASLAGKRSTIFMPASTPLPKVEATRHYGAVTILGHEVVDDCIAEARAFAEAGGAQFVPPFDDPMVIAGQGTLGLELVDEAPDAEVVLVPVGGGGLLAGVAVALKARRPGVRVVGVEAEGAAAMAASLAAGEPRALASVHTIADGIAIKCPSWLTLAHAEALVDDMVTVTDAEIGRALVLLLERSKMVVEPAGVVGLAALLAGKVPGDGPALAVLSGGNVDPLVLTRLIEHGLTAAGRYVRLRIVVPDRPGALAAITSEVARLGLNVLSVNHQREGSVVGIDEVEVLLTLETRDPEHRLEVVDALRRAGFQVELVG